jgi:hypothetical protein
MAIAKEHDLYVIEDNCQAVGSDYTFPDGMVRRRHHRHMWAPPASSRARTSVAMVMVGRIFTDDDALAKKLRQVCNHGSEVRYYHDVVGVNSRLDSRFKPRCCASSCASWMPTVPQCQAAAAFYDQAFAGMEHVHVPERSPNSTHVFHQYTLRMTGGHRDGLRAALGSERCSGHDLLPGALHLQKALQERSALPVKDAPGHGTTDPRSALLPMSTELDNEQLTHITATVKSFFQLIVRAGDPRPQHPLRMNIAVVGTGYVGLVTGTCFAETGNHVICVDIDANKVQMMKDGKVPIYEPHLDVLFERNIRQGRLSFTTDLASAQGCTDHLPGPAHASG